uniref:Retinol dehydrogenase 1 n=1 Tax=Sphaeramia orbicularis TaxID=375764 RepID=A0A672YDQ0_9TELE
MQRHDDISWIDAKISYNTCEGWGFLCQAPVVLFVCLFVNILAAKLLVEFILNWIYRLPVIQNRCPLHFGKSRSKHVLITGCDSGFGNLLARQLDGRGFRVIAACLTEEGASALSSLASPRLKTLQLDVTDSASIRRAVEAVRAEVGERGPKIYNLQKYLSNRLTWCMSHALTARFPRTRYGAGWDAKFLWIPLSYLPSFVSDFITNLLLPAPKNEKKKKE